MSERKGAPNGELRGERRATPEPRRHLGPRRHRSDATQRMGIIPVETIGRRLAFHEDLYHWVLTLSWRRFFAAFTVLFLALNLGFALAYRFGPGTVANASSFLDFFFFSVETLATIGYGEMAPQGTYSHFVVALEAFVGIAFSAVMTGIIFARFARPTAKIVFADRAVIGPRNGVPHLMFRMANWRRNQIVEAKISAMVLLTEVTQEGETLRRPAPLQLVRNKNPMFALSWTVMHMIDETSPFFGPGALEKLRAQRAEIFLSLSGMDETIMQTIHARFRYQLEDIEQNARFVDILTLSDDGLRTIDFERFHDTVAIDGT